MISQPLEYYTDACKPWPKQIITHACLLYNMPESRPQHFLNARRSSFYRGQRNRDSAFSNRTGCSFPGFQSSHPKTVGSPRNPWLCAASNQNRNNVSSNGKRLRHNDRIYYASGEGRGAFISWEHFLQVAVIHGHIFEASCELDALARRTLAIPKKELMLYQAWSVGEERKEGVVTSVHLINTRRQLAYSSFLEQLHFHIQIAVFCYGGRDRRTAFRQHDRRKLKSTWFFFLELRIPDK